MTLIQTFKNHTKLMGIGLGSLLISAVTVNAPASANPLAQLPSQQPGGIVTPVNPVPMQGGSPLSQIDLSQIRVADTPPYPQNPCPSILYEAPHNQRVVVPSVCTPNLITQQLDSLGLLETVRSQRSGAMVAPTNPTQQSGGMVMPMNPVPMQGAMPLSQADFSQISVADIPPYPQNPCPGILYEAPHNERVVVPSVCSPNLITRQLESLGLLETVRNRLTTPTNSAY